YVDITATSDIDGGYNVAWTEKGEWLGFTVTAIETGAYTLSVRLSHPGQGGTFHLEVDGMNVTGTIQVPDTGGWDLWQTVTSRKFFMMSGLHVLYLVAD